VRFTGCRVRHPIVFFDAFPSPARSVLGPGGLDLSFLSLPVRLLLLDEQAKEGHMPNETERTPGRRGGTDTDPDTPLAPGDQRDRNVPRPEEEDDEME